MNRVVFPITKLRKLRKLAEKARSVPEDVPEGWSRSQVRLERLLEPFESLRLAEGWKLCAYQFREGGNGNGVVWALLEDAAVPEPEDCPRVEAAFLSPPKPRGARDLMSVIEGDGSPWSYLSASLLAREAGEFGAMWHGLSWSVEEMLWRPPAELAEVDPAAETEDSLWRWMGPSPECWRPSCSFDFETICVAFLTASSLGSETIQLHTDSYQHGSYSFETEVTEIAQGPGGFVF